MFRACESRVGDTMAMTDPIADFLTRLRNAMRRRHPDFRVPASRLKAEVARVLQQEGFIQSVESVVEDRHPVLRVQLRYLDGELPIIAGLRRVSKPGHRVYVGHRAIPSVMRGMGIAILSTPKGVMTGSAARKQGIGGEVLCFVW
jgi:small subunit ribosomal protein S8